MPHKVNAAKRQGAPRAKRRVTNWKAYDAALRQRGSLTIWFTQEFPPALTRRPAIDETGRWRDGSL